MQELAGILFPPHRTLDLSGHLQRGRKVEFASSIALGILTHAIAERLPTGENDATALFYWNRAKAVK